MGIKEKRLALFIFFYFSSHLFYAHGEELVSAYVQENGAKNIRPNDNLSTIEGSKDIISVDKRGTGGHGGHPRGRIPGRGRTPGRTPCDGPCYPPGTTTVIPIFGAGAANRHNHYKPHNGANGPKQRQVGFGGVNVAILTPLVLILCSLWL